MEQIISEEESLEILQERYALAKDAIANSYEEILDIKSDDKKQPLISYFAECLEFCVMLIKTLDTDLNKLSTSELKKLNNELYTQILPGNYVNSYTDPEYAVKHLGEAEKYLGEAAKHLGEAAPVLCAIAAELRAAIPAVFEKNLEGLVIRLELILEVLGILGEAVELEKHLPAQGAIAGDNESPVSDTNAIKLSVSDINAIKPSISELKEAFYYYVFDYTAFGLEERVTGQIDPGKDFFVRHVMESDLSDIRYLYLTGEYITEDEERTAAFINGLSQETIQTMADTYTEGYRIGFEVGRKDISKKKTVNIRYTVGFERVIRQAILNFRKIGLEPTIFRQASGILENKGINRIGVFGAAANKQFDFDHKEDLALVMDKKFVAHKLELLKNIYENNKDIANVHGGPAVMEIFGEEDFEPVNKPEALKFDAKQQSLVTQYTGKSGLIVNEYIKGEERSFTIIAFPVPAIGDRFNEIFEETIKINTLDYKLYQKIQQDIIDALDECTTVYIKGKNGNTTDLTVSLCSLNNPEKETIFENCVADVNIPVGEVFTSPKLSGTTGRLHVSRVFLNELAYDNLWFEIKDGMITDYGCSNFDEESDNKKLIRENILFHHETLPMGEFAIGTNTTAYRVGKEYDIAAKLPILIAEKTGPHFAFGDTCYSHAEELAAYNPDGKEIIARDNECSLLRNTEPDKAYFNCHTDVTIPFEELDKIVGIKADGNEVYIIRDGKFVLPGTEELNTELDKNF